MRRLLAASAATIAVLGVTGLTARAAQPSPTSQPPAPPSPSAGIDQNTHTGISASGGTISVTAGDSGTSGTEISTGSTPVCTSTVVDPTSAASLINDNPNASVTVLGDPGKGTWYLITCPGGISLVFSGPNQPAPPAVPNPQVLAQEAVASLQLATPSVSTAPPLSAYTAVNMDTWFYIDRSVWHQLSATASVAGVSATATAVPTETVWTTCEVSPTPCTRDEGSGTLTCSGPGVPYDEQLAATGKPPCVYYYAAPGTYRLTATIYYSVTWTARGAPGGGTLGLIAGPSTTVPIQVDEIISVNTDGG